MVMKKEISNIYRQRGLPASSGLPRCLQLFILLIIIIAGPVKSSADYACALCTDLLGDDLGGGVSVFSLKMIKTGYIGSSQDSACNTAMLAARDAELQKSVYNGGTCSASTLCCLATDCNNVVAVVQCATAWMADKVGREHTVSGNTKVTGVNIGSESNAAETVFQAFDGSNTYPDYASRGLVRTDGLKGYSYTTESGVDDSHVNVTVDMWKRGGYAPTGQITTLENVTGGGGGGGLTKADVQDAVNTGVGDALNSKGLTGADLLAKMKESLDYGSTQGYFDHSNLSWEDFPGIKPSDLAGTFSGGQFAENPDSLSSEQKTNIKNAFVDSLQSPMNDFIGNMKTTNLYHSVGDFFDPANLPSGESPIDVDLSTDTFGSWTFHWSQYQGFLNIIRVVLLIAFGYASVRVVMHGGGG